jgi:hypothetical protein
MRSERRLAGRGRCGQDALGWAVAPSSAARTPCARNRLRLASESERDKERGLSVVVTESEPPVSARPSVPFPGYPKRTGDPAGRCVLPDDHRAYRWRPQRRITCRTACRVVAATIRAAMAATVSSMRAAADATKKVVAAGRCANGGERMSRSKRAAAYGILSTHTITITTSSADQGSPLSVMHQPLCSKRQRAHPSQKQAPHGLGERLSRCGNRLQMAFDAKSEKWQASDKGVQA